MIIDHAPFDLEAEIGLALRASLDRHWLEGDARRASLAVYQRAQRLKQARADASAPVLAKGGT